MVRHRLCRSRDWLDSRYEIAPKARIGCSVNTIRDGYMGGSSCPTLSIGTIGIMDDATDRLANLQRRSLTFL